MNILDEIVAHKREEIAERKKTRPLASSPGAPPDFVAALRSAPIGVIAEVKRRSPSAGVIRDPFAPADIARAYEAAGAQAVSVLMDETYFGGGEAHFREVREAVRLPLLYKEFVVDPWQVRHAAALGASAVLLIAAVLSDEELANLRNLCRELHMAPLVEVHDREEMKRAAFAGADCIGINNRDLKTFEVHLDTSLRLREDAPRDAALISESGIKTAEDVRILRNAGFCGILVGQRLLEQADPGETLAELMKSA